MAYNFTIQARSDIGRPQKDVNVRIKDITIRLVGKSITVIVQKTDRSTFDSEEVVFTFTDMHFFEMAGSAPSGGTLYEAIKSEVWRKLIQVHKRDISFGGEPPKMPDGTAESTPEWLEVV